MKKLYSIILFISILNFTTLLAQDRTSQTVHSIRNVARNASTQVDAVYTNPAGLVKLTDGLHISINNQSVFQKNEIQTDFSLLSANRGNERKSFKSKTSSIIAPNLLTAYKKGRWVFSVGLGVSNSDKLKFTQGIPSFESSIANLPLMLTRTGIETNKYSLNSNIEKTSFTYNIQLGASYAFSNIFSAYGGLRFNLMNNKFNGFITDIRVNPVDPSINVTGEMILAADYFKAVSETARNTAIALNPLIEHGIGSYTLAQLVGTGQLSQDMANRLAEGLGNPENFNSMTIENIRTAYIANAETNAQNSHHVADKYLDSSQSGWGISPIIGINFNYDKLNVGIKYEFKTELNLENKTKRDDIGNCPDGVKVSNALPALFTLGASYQLTPKLLASIAYHHFFETKNNKQEFTPKTSQYLAGLEYKLNDKLLFSIGGQISRPKQEDEYQTELNYTLKSYTIGGGLAYNVTEKMCINVGYQYTGHSNYTQETDNFRTDVFSKKKTVIAVGIDYHF